MLTSWVHQPEALMEPADVEAAELGILRDLATLVTDYAPDPEPGTMADDAEPPPEAPAPTRLPVVRKIGAWWADKTSIEMFNCALGRAATWLTETVETVGVLETCRRARNGEIVVVRARYRLVSAENPPPAMGAFLDKPKTEKTNNAGAGNGIAYGIATMQGWRVDMEDAHTSVIGVESEGPLALWSFFAVYDGHAGSKVAAYSSTHLLPAIMASADMKEAVSLIKAGSGESEKEKVRNLMKAGIREGFLKLDESMQSIPEVYGDSERSGSTAVSALLTPDAIFIANLGDSRAILARKNEVEPFGTDDHKPYLPRERERIENAGGSVMIQRVNGSLAVSRALGDYEYKQVPGLAAVEQQVSPEPDVYVVEREEGRDEFLLLACDGIFDVMTNEELSGFVRSRLRITHDLPPIANQVLDSCLSKGSRDNMSVILITLPGVPEVSDSARLQEQELHRELHSRIQGIASEAPPEAGPLETDTVIRILHGHEIPGVPPGAGIHAVRSIVEEILVTVKAESGPPKEKDAGLQKEGGVESQLSPAKT